MSTWARAGASIVAVALFATGCASTPAPQAAVRAGAKYVAMGSSFAAGPGVTTSADTPPTRCKRSADNYAHQLARRRGLQLVDVSCGGATTRHILGPWSELAPQVEAVTPDTRLVTVTIGGNDLNYIGGLMMASCRQRATDAGTRLAKCPARPQPTEEAFAAVEGQLRAIAAEVRRRAPEARLIFVDYPAVLPQSGVCTNTPLAVTDADAARRVAQRLSQITESVARETGSSFLAASRLSGGHDACAAEAWMNGFPHAAAYHPNLAGMTAVADALDRMLR